MEKSAAFTLAEVLITLGIIGVVAAMTIPTLISNMKGARIRAQFKKGISTLNQAVRLNVANYDWDFSAIERADELGNSGNNCSAALNPEDSITICSLLNANLSGKTFLGNYEYDKNKHGYKIKNFDYDETIGSPAFFVLYQLSDGMIIGINRHSEKCTKAHFGCTGFIDINGKSLPNKKIECSDPSKTKAIWKDDYEECTVKITGDTGDVFPIAFYDSTVVPSTNAGKYILNTAK